MTCSKSVESENQLHLLTTEGWNIVYPSAVDDRDSIMYEQLSIVGCDAVSGYNS
jgi:hypothetical protein